MTNLARPRSPRSSRAHARASSRLPRLGPALAAVLVVVAAPSHDAGAVGTRTFDLDTLEALSGGELKGVAVGSDGAVRAGWTLGSVPLPDASAAFAALPLADGSILIGTSPGGRVVKVAGDQATTFAETGQLAVTALCETPWGVLAATIPNGKIFRLAGGKAEEFATLPETEHVWALAVDKAKTALLAATGPSGKLFRVQPNGQSSVLFDSDEPHLVSLAVDDATGDVLAGSSGKALLYRVAGPGRAQVVYDFPGEEVKAVAVGKGGVVYAIANEYGEMPEPPRRNGGAGRAPPGPSSAPRPKPGKGTLFRFDAAGRPEKMTHSDDFQYTALALDDAGKAYVGTGAEGRVYAVDDAHAQSLVADVDERQIGAIVFAGAKGGRGVGAVVVGSDPAVVHRVVGRGGEGAVWTSKVLDAGLRARFGHVGYRAQGALEVATRTGNAATPDGTWSDWSPGLASGAAIPSPAGRYVQVRARWSRDPDAVLEDVSLPFVTDNLRPVVLDVTGVQRGAARGTREGVVPSGAEPPKHDAVVKLSWKVDDTDGDVLRYRLAFRREGQTLFRPILPDDEVLSKTDYEWDTQALPEGRYRVRVEASDEPSNPPGQAERHALESSPFLVDNTPPVISGLSVQGGRLKARVVDGASPVVRVEFATDGKTTFLPLPAKDGILDTPDETIDVDLGAALASSAPEPASTPSSPKAAPAAKTPRLVAVRAYDAAGNSVVQEVESR